MGPDRLAAANVLGVVAIDGALLREAHYGPEKFKLTGGSALPEDDPPDVTRFKPAAATRVQAHRWRYIG